MAEGEIFRFRTVGCYGEIALRLVTYVKLSGVGWIHEF